MSISNTSFAAANSLITLAFACRTAKTGQEKLVHEFTSRFKVSSPSPSGNSFVTARSSSASMQRCQASQHSSMHVLGTFPSASSDTSSVTANGHLGVLASGTSKTEGASMGASTRHARASKAARSQQTINDSMPAGADETHPAQQQGSAAKLGREAGSKQTAEKGIDTQPKSGSRESNDWQRSSPICDVQTRNVFPGVRVRRSTADSDKSAGKSDRRSGAAASPLKQAEQAMSSEEASQCRDSMADASAGEEAAAPAKQAASSAATGTMLHAQMKQDQQASFLATGTDVTASSSTGQNVNENQEERNSASCEAAEPDAGQMRAATQKGLTFLSSGRAKSQRSNTRPASPGFASAKDKAKSASGFTLGAFSKLHNRKPQSGRRRVHAAKCHEASEAQPAATAPSRDEEEQRPAHEWVNYAQKLQAEAASAAQQSAGTSQAQQEAYATPQAEFFDFVGYAEPQPYAQKPAEGPQSSQASASKPAPAAGTASQQLSEEMTAAAQAHARKASTEAVIAQPGPKEIASGSAGEEAASSFIFGLTATPAAAMPGKASRSSARRFKAAAAKSPFVATTVRSSGAPEPGNFMPQEPASTSGCDSDGSSIKVSPPEQQGLSSGQDTSSAGEFPAHQTGSRAAQTQQPFASGRGRTAADGSGQEASRPFNPSAAPGSTFGRRTSAAPHHVGAPAAFGVEKASFLQPTGAFSEESRSHSRPGPRRKRMVVRGGAAAVPQYDPEMQRCSTTHSAGPARMAVNDDRATRGVYNAVPKMRPACRIGNGSCNGKCLSYITCTEILFDSYPEMTAVVGVLPICKA